MKNRRALVMMALAIVLGLLAVLLASHWLLRQSPAGKGKIVVAAADVNLGQRLSPDMLRLAEWPAESLPEGALQDPLKLSGRVLKSSVLRGEPLSEAKLAPAGTLGGLSALITEGRRAITVRVNDVIGVAGFALPGNFVDILVNTDDSAKGGGGGQAISKIVLERILVLAVAQESSRDDNKPKVVNAVTLELTPDQVEKLDLARSVGTLSLVLRPDGSVCDDEEPGELVHRGALVALGYWNDAARTAERFKPLPPRADGLVVPELAVWSGDTVRRDADGYLYFVGRNDEMIKTSGYRVSPAEIEEVAYASGLVAEAAALGVPHPLLGAAIALLVTAAPGAELGREALLSACRQRLPAYMMPLWVDIRAEALPRNPNGKIDRALLAREIAEVLAAIPVNAGERP